MTGSLQIKSGIYYAVLNFKDDTGKRRQKWICTELEVKNNKTRAKEFLTKALAEHDNMKTSYRDNILFADYMLEWLETVKAGWYEPSRI